jgi:hypothetical protein
VSSEDFRAISEDNARLLPAREIRHHSSASRSN